MELAAGQAAAQPAGAETAHGSAKPPHGAVSMGYADSHNPPTARLLRSSGTTRLLQDSLSSDADDDEEDLLAEVAGGHVAAGDTVQALALADAGGITARTNGTTKLLADMTMASMVGVKLLGSQAQGASTGTEAWEKHTRRCRQRDVCTVQGRCGQQPSNMPHLHTLCASPITHPPLSLLCRYARGGPATEQRWLDRTFSG